MSPSVAAPEIVSNEPGGFARAVLTERHPALIERVRADHPYPPAIQRNLDALAESLTGAIPPPSPRLARAAGWDMTAHVGERWLDVPFLWAENYFYRALLDAVCYFEPGPWRGIDPFGPQKLAELDTPEFAAELAGFAARPPTVALLDAALWGNRADLGFRLSDPQAAAREHARGLLADDGPAVIDVLDDPGADTICLIADNAGRELAADLMLVDHLLALDGADRRVELHVKPAPYFVSDATVADLLAVLARLSRTRADRLRAALRAGTLTVTTHEFYCTPQTFHDLPDELAESFRRAALTIVKGDLNYRRLVGDRHWPPTTPFGALTGYFPGPLAALRTLKSDVAVGLDAPTVAELDRAEPNWRTSGTHAVIQARW
jgi:hypothetical protein